MNDYLGHYDVRIVDGRRTGESPGKCNRIIIESEGFSTKDARRRIEAEVALWELHVPPGPVYTDDHNQDTDFTGNTSLLEGKDPNPAGTPGPGLNVPAVLVPRWEIANKIIDEIKHNQCDQVLGVGNVNPTGLNPNKFKGKDLPKLEKMVNSEIACGHHPGKVAIGAADTYLIKPSRCFVNTSVVRLFSC